MGDLRNVLTGLNGAINKPSIESFAESTDPVSQSADNEFKCGEHLACEWHKNCLQWFLGVVDVVDGEDLYVSYMKRSDKQGLKWLFPEKAVIHQTSTKQVLLRNVPVSYSLTAIIRCEISSQTLIDIQATFDKINLLTLCFSTLIRLICKLFFLY